MTSRHRLQETKVSVEFVIPWVFANLTARFSIQNTANRKPQIEQTAVQSLEAMEATGDVPESDEYLGDCPRAKFAYDTARTLFYEAKDGLRGDKRNVWFFNLPK